MFTLHLKKPFEPLYFLNALGAGGIAVSFFMIFMFFVPKEKGVPVPTFEAITQAFFQGNILMQGAIIVAYLGMFVFASYHVYLLIKKLSEYAAWKKTEKYQACLNSNAEVQLMAIPLTFGMTMNVLFSFSMAFIPGIWNSINYLFPVAIAGFLLIGFFAISMILRYYRRLFSVGNFDFEKNNNFSQLLSVFALAMIGVGLSGPAAMSTIKEISSVALIASLGFFSVALVLFVVHFIIGFKSSLRSGWAKENSPTIWIILPFLTLFGIAMIRYQHAFHMVLHQSIEKSQFFFITVIFFFLQVFFGLLGYALMKENAYFDEYTKGEKESSVGSFALICPGVAMYVLGMFMIHKGLVENAIIVQFGWIYWILYALLFVVWIKTLFVYWKLNKKLLTKSKVS